MKIKFRGDSQYVGCGCYRKSDGNITMYIAHSMRSLMRMVRKYGGDIVHTRKKKIGKVTFL